MTLFAKWEKENCIILAAQAKALSTNWKEEKYFCNECKEQLTPVEEQWRSRNGLYFVQPYFSHKPNSTCKLAQNESEEHKSKKNKLFSLLFLEKIVMDLNGLQTVLKKEWIKGTEIHREINKSDVLVEFKEFNPVYGNGICFEIMESETEESINDKRQLWLRRGYTVVPIKKDEDLNSIIETGIKIKQPYLKWLYDDVKKAYTKLDDLVIRAENLAIQQEIIQSPHELMNCEKCCYCSPDNRNKGLLICWKFWKTNKIRKYVVQDNNCNFFCPRGEE